MASKRTNTSYEDRDIVVLGGARTPFGTFNGTLKDISAIDLGAIAAKAALERSGVDAKDVDQIVFGNVLQTSKDAIYFARHIGLKVGAPIETPALTVNRLCGSGLQAIVSAAQSLLLGEGSVALVGGGENMTQAPFVIRGARAGLNLGEHKLEDYLWEALVDSYCGLGMALTAENLAEQYKLDRQTVDAYALRSQEAARHAQQQGWLAEEITPVTIKDRKGKEVVVDQDEGIRETSMEALAKLPARFREGGVVTAGNASGINDAGAALVIATGAAARERGLQAAGAAGLLGRRRRGPDDHGHRPGPGDPPGAQARRPDARQAGPRRGQRGVRGAISRRGERPGAGPRARPTSTAARSR